MLSWSFRVARFAAALATLTLVPQSARGQSGPAGNPPCIRYWTEAALGFAGYNHLVHISNACSQTADCDVVTSANPVPIEVTIPVSDARVVITYRESPARAFQAKVRCRLE